MQAWLIEYTGAVPGPVYVPEDFSTSDGTYTMSAWAAKRFKTKAEAEAYMANPIDDEGKVLQAMPYSTPWTATEHSFNLTCECCGCDPGFTRWGRSAWCDGCIPF